MLYRLPAGIPYHLLCLLRPTAARWSSGCRIESAALTLIIFFHLKRAQFCSRCLLRFDPAFSGSRLVRCPFSSRESLAPKRKTLTKNTKTKQQTRSSEALPRDPYVLHLPAHLSLILKRRLHRAKIRTYMAAGGRVENIDRGWGELCCSQPFLRGLAATYRWR